MVLKGSPPSFREKQGQKGNKMSYAISVISSEKRFLYELMKFRIFHIDQLLKTADKRSSKRLIYEKECLKKVLAKNSFSAVTKDVVYVPVKRKPARLPQNTRVERKNNEKIKKAFSL